MAWQGADRIRADTIDIDREQRVLTAQGHVRTRFVDRQKDPTKQAAAGAAAAAPAAAPAFVSIDAAALVYTESSRTAHYTGGVHLTRPGMDVKAAELRAWLNDANAASSLDRAFADGKVVVVRATPGRTLKGAGEHAEYYTTEERILLTGGDATLVDSARGLTKGRELTYYVNLDKLLVNGREQQPVTSRILRRL
ncbi:MAG: LptA/OstA family protein [Bryobacteraceae bacterium]